MVKATRLSLLISWLVVLCVVAGPSLALARVAPAAAPQEKEEEKDETKKKPRFPFGKGKDEKKEAAKGETEKLSKQEREYQKVKQFSQETYAKYPVFRDEVDAGYRLKQREHGEFAYVINTRDAADEQIMRTGDRVKIEDTLYDNPLVQDYVNRVGQSLVPQSSSRLYAFKVTLKPIPEARALSTGTVYISSGLLSQIDNEAQLAYILGHEIAHVEKNHWLEDVLVAHGMEAYNEKQQKKRSLFSALAVGATAGVVGGAGGSVSATLGSTALALAVAPTLLKFIIPNATVAWDKLQEDEADQLGLKYMLDRSYDPREVPKFYASLQQASQRDLRASLGFMGDPMRLAERGQMVGQVITGYGPLRSGLVVGAASVGEIRKTRGASTAPGGPTSDKALNASRDALGRAAAADKAIGGELAAGIQGKLDAGELIGSSAEFEAVMAELKRDNGIRAYYYDMFQMALSNLEESILIRSNDPFSHFYYGKVLKLTARSATEKSRALGEFVRAIELDRRRVLAEPHLYRALAMIDAKDPAQTPEIVASLQQYVSIYQRGHGGALPENMDVIYDYMQEAGEMTWAAMPATNVSTKDIEPVTISVGRGDVAAASSPASPTTVAPAAKTDTSPRSTSKKPKP